MADPVSQFATRIAYGARQLPRVAWYIGHGMVMRRLSQAARERAGASTRPRAHTRASVPDRRRLYADMAVLFRQDLANVEAGIYPLPADHDGTLPVVLGRSRLFFADLPDVHRRREKAEYRQVLTEDTRGKRPDYYLRNFHFQSGGWLTQDSARRYDTQVEVLFNGSANATRRQALLPLHEVFARRDQRRLRVLDVGCGTGRFLDAFKQAWPRLPALGVDLSEPYVAEARRHLQRWCWLNLMIANGEALPVKDESRPRVAARRPRRGRGLPANRRRARLRRHARTLSAELSRALLQELSQGGLRQHRWRLRPDARPRRERFRLQGDGVRQAMKVSKLRAVLRPGNDLLSL